METEDLTSNVLNPNSGSRRVLSLVANRWTVLVMYLLAVSGTMRFGQIQQVLSVSQKVLTHTLRELERHGLVERKVYPVIPPKVEYSLTELGLTLQEPLTHLCHWAEAHIADLDMVTGDVTPNVLNVNCGSRRVLSLVANRWTTLLMYLLAVSGTMRFNQLQQTLRISQKILTHTLRNLEYRSLVERKVYPITPPKVEYSLTELGLTLQEPLTHLSRWGETHIADLEKALAAQYDPTSISEGSK